MKAAVRIKKATYVSDSHESAQVEVVGTFRQHNTPQESKPLPYDYAGGFDHCLLELSDVLPASCYQVLPKAK